MSSEFAAGLLGGLLALLAGLASQTFGAFLSNRRRVRELAGRYLAVLKSVGYLADRARYDYAVGRLDNVDHVLQVQTEVIGIGSELEMICPKRLRRSTRGAVNGAIDVISSHNSDDPRTWAAKRQAFDDIVRDYNLALGRLF